MEGSIRLSAADRKTVLKAYRSGDDVQAARRAQIVLLAAHGWSLRELRAITFASFGLMLDCLRRFRVGGVAAVIGQLRRAAIVPQWLARVLAWLAQRTPRDFGFFRARWSCATLAEALAWETGTRVSPETLRRRLRLADWRWRRPRPVVGLVDPDHAAKVRQIRDLLSHLPDDETAVFQDEVDVHLNPKIGACWMPCGQQAEVVTPGNNQKCHVAGSLHWRTGTLLVSPQGRRRDTRLFLRHLDYLRARLRNYRRIHVICDNAAFHRSRAVNEYLARWQHRLELHWLPRYAPQTNPIERVWWHFHENITRNHRCSSLEQLLDQAYEWFAAQRGHFLEMRKIVAQAA